MVHFEPHDEEEQTETGLAPVAYLPGAAPGMKRRSPRKSAPADTSAPGMPADDSDAGGDDTADDASADAVGPPVTRFSRLAVLPTIVDDGEPDAPAAVDDTGVAEEAVDEVGSDESEDAEFAPNAEDERERAEKVLLHRLRGRSLSSVEALLVVNGTGVDSGEASEIIEKFLQLGYLDEVRLADQIIHSHNVRKGLGRNGVEAEMRRRKLDPAVMMDKLEELPDDEAERAIDLANKRITQLERFDDATIDRRLSAFLMRKGYSSTLTRLAVRAAMDGRGGGGSSRVRFR